MTNSNIQPEGKEPFRDALRIVSREVQYNESIERLGNLALIYGFEPHSPLTFDLLSLPEVRALAPYASKNLFESVCDVVEQLKIEAQPVDLPVGKPILWKRNKRKHISVGVFNTGQTLEERKKILRTIQDVAGIEQLPEVFQNYQPKINIAYKRKSVSQPPEKIVTHFSKVLPNLITVSKIN